jgi:hypothetical protein
MLNELVGVYNVGTHKDLDKVNESKNSADSAKEGANYLHNALFGLTQHKVMDTYTAEEEANESHNDLILTVKVSIIAFLFVLKCNAAAKTNSRIRRNLFTTVMAIGITGSLLNAAVQADSLIIVHLGATVLTVHRNTSKYC